MPPEISFVDVLLILAVGLIAGTINAVAGGGSLLTMPTLIFLGLPPQVANATVRLSVLLGGISSTSGYISKGISPLPHGIWLGISATIGAVLGTQLAMAIDPGDFKKILAGVMLVVVAITLFQPTRSQAEQLLRIGTKHRIIATITFFFIGIYGGFIQAGIGFIILAALGGIHRFGLVQSNVIKTFVVVIYTIAAVFIFAREGLVYWTYGLILAAGDVTGSWLSSRYAVKKGDRWIKRFLVVAVCGMAIKLWFF